LPVKIKGLKRHTFCRVTWFDVLEDSVGDPAQANLVRRITHSTYWGQKRAPGTGIMCLVFTPTIDEDDQSQAGWICIPKNLVVDLKILRVVEEPDGDEAKV
jgi:hypothetical protein